METLHLLGALLIYLLSPTLQPPPPSPLPHPLINVASKTKNAKKLNSQHWKGEREGALGKVEILDTAGTGIEKKSVLFYFIIIIFFNGSVSTILQLVVGRLSKS